MAPGESRAPRPNLAIVVLCLIAGLTVLAPVSHACSCIWYPQEWYLDYYDYVFEGTVVSVTQRPDLYLDVVFEVAETYKGPCEATSRLTVVTWSDGAGCGYDFLVGFDYIVFAAPSSLGLSTHLCSNTQRSTFAPASLRTLLEEYAGNPVSPPVADPETAFAAASGVFQGRVVSVGPVNDSFRVVFDVAASWKEVSTSRVTLYVDAFPAGQGFTLQEEYVVFADFVDGYWTSSCGNALRLADAETVLDWLGEPTVTPVEPVTWGRLKERYETP
jgi:hypothetical protein